MDDDPPKILYHPKRVLTFFLLAIVPLFSFFVIYPVVIQTDVRRGFAHKNGRSQEEFARFAEHFGISYEGLELWVVLITAKGGGTLTISQKVLDEVARLDDHLRNFTMVTERGEVIESAPLFGGDINHLFKWMSSGLNEEDLLAEVGDETEKKAIDKEEEERLLGENTDGTTVLDEAAAALLSGAKGGDPVSSRKTRSKSRDLELSKKPMDAVKRIRVKVETLRERLMKREEDKGVSRNGRDEFAGIFDEESKGIEANLKLIEGEYVISSTKANKEINKWKKQCEGETDKMRVWEDSLATAVDGTDFNSLEEMRAGYDDLSREKKEREKMESAILQELGLGSIEEMAGQIRKGNTVDVCAETSNELLELVTESLGVMECEDLEEAAIEMRRLRNETREQTNVLEEVMGIVQVTEFHAIAETIQFATMAREELEKRCRELERQLARSADVVQELTEERDKAAGMVNKYEQEITARNDGESSDDDSSTSVSSQIQRLKQLRQEMKPPARPSQRLSEEETSERPETGVSRKSSRISGEKSKGNEEVVAEGAGVVQESRSVVRVNPSKLPPLTPFDGTKEKWKVFEDGFLLRYEQMGDSIARQMLSEMIEGRARKEYKGLPDEYKSKSVRDCLTWLKDRCLGGSLYVSLENERKLREQTVKGRKVVDVCREMEEWIDKLHTDVAKQEEMKKKQLVFLYEKEDREIHSKLLSMYEKEKSYEDMKRKLEVREYQARRESYDRPNKSAQVRGQVNGAKFSSGTGSNGMRSAIRTCFSCFARGHSSFNCPNKSGSGIICQKCGGKGHSATVCTSREWKRSSEGQSLDKKNTQSFPTAVNANNASPTFTPILNPARAIVDSGQSSGKYGQNRWNGKGNGSNLAARKCGMSSGEKEDEGTVDDSHPESVDSDDADRVDDPFFVKKFRPVEGTIGGLQVEACLDTGADINLIDKRSVDQMIGVEMKREIRHNLRDAQGRSIKTIGTVVADVKMNVGRECRVGFFVSEGDLNAILLGNSALEAMGLELRMKEDLEQSDKGSEKAKTDDAVVLRAECIPSGEMGIVLVGGGRVCEGSKVLITEREEVVEGTNHGSMIVRVPVWNGSNTDMVFAKNDVIGEWCKLDAIEKDSPQLIELEKSGKLQVNQCVMGSELVAWNQIKENLEISRNAKLGSRLENILKTRAEVFAVNDEDLGRMGGMECDIRLDENCTPIRQKERPVPFSLKPALRKLLDKMIAQGVIRKSNSPWLSPVVLVKKKDGSIRICIDFRRVNEVTREDAFPLPYIEDVLQSLQGKKVFSVMDLSSGFWQLPLNSTSAEVTAFATMGELYEFNVLPFGLNISPAIFQRSMSEVLKDELSKDGRARVVHCYIDDVLIATETEEEHEQVLARVLDTLKHAGLLLNMKKCKIMVDEIEYLGHKLSKNGVHIDEKKVQAILEYKRPESMSQLQTFLGMTGYHRRFIEGYGKIVLPLLRLRVTSGRKLMWTDEGEEAFRLLKHRLSTAPVLQQPDYSGAIDGSNPFILTTDASGCGIGAVLSQKGPDGAERPLQFFSRGLKDAEKFMSVVDTEALAVYESCTRWKHMLLGNRTIVRTDHQPLVTLLKRKNVASRLLRWANELQGYKLEIHHIKGKSNVVADAFSRNPREELPGENDGCSDDVGMVVNAVTRSKTVGGREEDERRRRNRENDEEEQNLAQWRSDQSKDQWVVEMIERVKLFEDGKIEDMDEEEVNIPGSTKRTSLADWVVKDGILYLLGVDHSMLIYVPEGKRDRFIEEIHNSPLSGHLSTLKLVQKLSQEAYWGSMQMDVQRVLRKCERCLMVNSRKRMIPPLQPLTANYPMDVVGIDLIEMGRSANGYKYIVTVIDHFTKFAGAYAVKDKKAETVAEVFMSRWMFEGCRTPKTLVSDNGTELVNQLMAEVSNRFTIERRLTLPYHSRANGLTERFNRTIVEIMKRIKMRDDEWDEALPYAVFAYNSSPHGTTGESPSYLLYGREERLPSSQIPQFNPAYTVDMDVDDYKRRMSWMMEKTRSVVVGKLESERRKMKELYDSKNKHNMHIVPEIGDRVYVKVEPKQGDVRKMMTQFEGPYRVDAKSNTTVTVVRINNGIDSSQEKDKRVVQWDIVRLAPREKEVNENKDRVDGVVCKMSMNEEINEEISRAPIDGSSPLHPDFECKTCGPRKAGTIISKENGMIVPVYEVGAVKFKSLRELGALYDMKEDWNKLTLAEATTSMKEMALNKTVSSVALKLAYQKGPCEHVLDEVSTVDRIGVTIEGEPESVSEAITEALVRGGGNPARKKCLVLAPADSVIFKADGRWKELDVAEYRDEEALKSNILRMVTAHTVPRVLFVIISSTFKKEHREDLKNYLKETLKAAVTTIYVSADLLPARHCRINSETVNIQQAWLTAWRLENPPKNLIVLSAFSGMLWTNHAFVTLFEVSRKQTKELFENAFKNIVYGKDLPFESGTETPTFKRRIEDTGKNGPTHTYPKKSFSGKTDPPGKKYMPRKCYICQGEGHLAAACPGPASNHE